MIEIDTADRRAEYWRDMTARAVAALPDRDDAFVRAAITQALAWPAPEDTDSVLLDLLTTLIAGRLTPPPQPVRRGRRRN